MSRSSLAEPAKTGFRQFNPCATDVVLAAEFNQPGTHLAVRWVGPSLGLAFGTIGDDNKFKLWREDLSQMPQSGRRFRCVFSQSPTTHVPYAAFDFRTLKHEVWLVIVSRDGLLSLLELSEPESLHTWKEIDSLYPFGQHVRGSEPVFRLSLHQTETPSCGALSAGLDSKAISLALSASTSIKILRATKSENGNYHFYDMLEMGTAVIINDVSWAPGSIRPYDLIAAAFDDGRVRIYEVATPHQSDAGSPVKHMSTEKPLRSIRTSSVSRPGPSGIGAGLAGVSRGEATRRAGGSGLIQHTWKEIAVLAHEDASPVWRIRWTHDENLRKLGHEAADNMDSSCLVSSVADPTMRNVKFDHAKQHLVKHYLYPVRYLN
ncbi:MAG: hypothetical protein Q9174_000579 [Haloplaca sp. 1 TL-2023]